MKNIKTIYFAALLLAAVSLPAARAQDTAPPANQAAANASPSASVALQASPTPIPYSEIIAQTENAAATLKEIQAGISSDATADTVERDLPALTDEINARLEETAQVIEGATSLDALRSFEADWRTLTRNLPRWRTALTERARSLEADARRIDELRERWSETLEDLRGTETPAEVLARIEEII